MAKEIDLSLQIIYDFYQKNITVEATHFQPHVLFWIFSSDATWSEAT